MHKNLVIITIISSIVFSCNTSTPKTLQNSLSKWNDTPIKKEIVEFVNKVTNVNNTNYVPPKERIAVFDNDGTLWNEKPLYIPLEFELDYIKTHYSEKPEWENDEFFSKLANNDLSPFKEYSSIDLIQKLFGAHQGQIETEYKQNAYDFLSNKNHPKFNRPFKEMIYSPMVELVKYLQENEFKVFIVTGGEITFARTVSEEIYNIPMENVIGSNVGMEYVNNTSDPYIIRTNEIKSANDKHIKPTNIELHIGRKPIFAAGNSDGDYEMMEYTLSGQGPSMAILVNHDDADREYAYMHGTEKAIADAKEKGWRIVSMKNDFKEIFSK
ncbi:HAD family hydrolase [Saccharicrinis aurantiacus]|uniref:HAD family hydrolase n=1 Tax=Saccharicrinis aurantiacus TaxID=1849719 RepID=UPI00094FFC0A|nr:HAD family hydrolase [Saccharicrinis aurantiacus]